MSNTELVSQDVGAHALSSGGSMQQTKTQYSTAISVQKPREIAFVEKSFLAEASLAGERFFYSWGAGRDKIEGGSIDLAMSLVRTWGNCAVEMQPVQHSDDAWIFTAAFVDLETGFTLSRQFRQSKKSVVHGKHDEERKNDIRFQIGQSKAIRNVVLNALPKWLADKAISAAKENVRDLVETAIQKKGMDTIQQLSVERLAKEGVGVSAILLRFGRSTIKALTVEDLIAMRSDAVALHEGQEVAESIYPSKAKSIDEDSGDAPTSRSEAAKGAMSSAKKKKKSTETKEEPMSLVDDYQRQIKNAKTLDDLEAISGQLADADLNEAEASQLIQAYESRSAELNGS